MSTLVIVPSEDDFKVEISPTIFIVSANAKSSQVRGMTVDLTYLVRMGESELRDYNVELFAAIRNSMVTSKGKFVAQVATLSE